MRSIVNECVYIYTHTHRNTEKKVAMFRVWSTTLLLLSWVLFIKEGFRPTSSSDIVLKLTFEQSLNNTVDI